MVKQWVQPPINKNRLSPGCFLLGSHLTSFIFCFIIKVFIGILGESIEIQFLAIFCIDFNKGFYQIWIRVLFVLLYILLLGFFIGILGESIEIQLLAIFYAEEFNQFWNQVCLFLLLRFFIGILGESFEIQFLAICYADFNEEFNQIWNRFLIIIRFLIGILGAS